MDSGRGWGGAAMKTGEAHSASIGLGSILKTSRKKARLSQQDVADALRVTRNTVINWEADRSKPDYSLIPVLCSLLRVPLHRLFSMPPDSGLTVQEDHLLTQFRRLSPPSRRAVDRMVSTLADEEQGSRLTALKETCRLFEIRPASVAAGTGVDVADPTPSYTFLRQNSTNEKADGIARVSGDSMEPVYHDGDYVYYLSTPEALPGTDVIVDTDDGAVIKRVAGDRTLFSVNAARPYESKTADNFLVVRGRVLGTVPSSDFLSREERNLAEEVFEDEVEAFRRKHRLNDWEPESPLTDGGQA